jgi:hypothetical protein
LYHRDQHWRSFGGLVWPFFPWQMATRIIRKLLWTWSGGSNLETCNLSHAGGAGRRIGVRGWPRLKQDSIWKIKQKKGWGHGSRGGTLKLKALSSNPSTTPLHTHTQLITAWSKKMAEKLWWIKHYQGERKTV